MTIIFQNKPHIIGFSSSFRKNVSITSVLFVIISTVLGVTDCFSQENSFEKLKTDFVSETKSAEENLNTAKLYLENAKKDNDLLKIVEGYELLVTHYSHTKTAISYSDSIILLSKNAKLDGYLGKGYLLKGTQLYYNSKYNEALDNFATANDLAIASKNIAQQISIKHYIGLLKNVSDEKEEALTIFQENLDFITKNDYQKKDKQQYLKSLFALADSYNKNRLLDSAEIVHQRGIVASLDHPDKYLYPWFLLSYGITSYFQEDYTKGKDSLQKAATFFKTNEKALSSTYLYIYRCLEKQEKNEESLQYLYKVDSIYQQHPKVVFQAREAYELLNTAHKTSGDDAARLSAIEKLLAVDDIISKDYQNLGKKIVTKYETPLLISEKEALLSKKEELITKLEDSNFLSQKTILVLIILSVLLSGAIFYFFRRNVVYKKRFDALMLEYENKEKKKEEEPVKKIPVITKASVGIPQEIIDSVLVKLDKFEKNHKFTKKSYTLTKLAKELDTNSTYLSKIINMTKGMNFAKYMNEIRIDYAITQLKENRLFRSYTIKAIAIEVGFNNAQSFSVAFNKKTGIHPSYFLKQLENQELKESA
ncbi:helix-turn-helix domain-containing protein [uncultured Kordia sp.]|uniref:helix-turn-helix domain-containing protein n=1 Tax=uncultured Kordia sp. TaxID=507699 RepID=UPI00260EAEF9|nr:helix-turn-helix domain-containing protein [uncultured Kordia sp.]